MRMIPGKSVVLTYCGIGPVDGFHDNPIAETGFLS
jgi:hypothetical protein